jgi:histone deacetylase 1/2
MRAFVASKSNPDILRFHEAMMADNADGFRTAMDLEISNLERMLTWCVVPCPEGANVLQGTWAFVRKRYPDGRIRKLKARFCVRGDQQVEGIDYFDSYAPVVQWSTVRIILIMTIVFGLATRQIDYNNAFAQSDLKEDVYVEIPRGYGKPEGDMVLKLNKTLYGLVQAPKAFYDHMLTGLENCGFQASIHDPCLFIHKDMIACSWVDDVICVSRNGKLIDEMILKLKGQGYDLDVAKDDDPNGEISAFLGIQVDKVNDGSYHLTQTGLIQKVIHYTGMDDCRPDATPAAATPLGSDHDGVPWTDRDGWEYPAALGMLMYLGNNTRPDIAFAVNQCARFSFSPKVSHGKALKRIVRYLKGTKEQGLIFSPSGELVVDCYVDSDFAGLWRSEDDQDPICVKSRTGHVLELAGCPLSWTSKLQTKVALSTLESEYIAYSQAMQELIPLRRVVSKIAKALDKEAVTSCRTFSKVFEDNMGTVQLVKVPKISPQNRHFAVKYHFFREHVARGDIQIIKVTTHEQKADIFTKGLVKEVFVAIRKLLMGW